MGEWNLRKIIGKNYFINKLRIVKYCRLRAFPESFMSEELKMLFNAKIGKVEDNFAQIGRRVGASQLNHYHWKLPMTFLRGVRVSTHSEMNVECFAWLVTPLSLRTLVTKLKIHATDGKSQAEASNASIKQCVSVHNLPLLRVSHLRKGKQQPVEGGGGGGEVFWRN